MIVRPFAVISSKKKQIWEITLNIWHIVKYSEIWQFISKGAPMHAINGPSFFFNIEKDDKCSKSLGLSRLITTTKFN